MRPYVISNTENTRIEDIKRNAGKISIDDLNKFCSEVLLINHRYIMALFSNAS